MLPRRKSARLEARVVNDDAQLEQTAPVAQQSSDARTSNAGDKGGRSPDHSRDDSSDEYQESTPSETAADKPSNRSPAQVVGGSRRGRSSSTKSRKKDQTMSKRNQKSHSCDHAGCQAVFPTLEKLKKHRVDKHGWRIQCPELNCDKSFTTQGNLDHHLRNIHNRTYSCEICHAPLPSKQGYDLLAHYQLAHTNKLNFFCKLCGLGFFKRSAVQKHQYNHHLSCDYTLCDKVEPKESLKKHMSQHPGRYECRKGWCHGLFDTKAELKEHTKLHGMSDGFLCNVKDCDQKFQDIEQLIEHESVDHGRSACSLCPKTFAHLEECLAHFYDTHEKHNLQCIGCSLELDSIQSCTNHLKAMCLNGKLIRVVLRRSSTRGVADVCWETGVEGSKSSTALPFNSRKSAFHLRDRASDLEVAARVSRYLASPTSTDFSAQSLEIEGLVVGAHLRRFQKSRLTAIAATSDIAAGRVLEDIRAFAKMRQLRDLVVDTDVDESQISVRQADGEGMTFSVASSSSTLLTEDEIAVLAAQIKLVLDRMSLKLSLLPSAYHSWLLTSAEGLARDELPSFPQLNLLHSLNELYADAFLSPSAQDFRKRSFTAGRQPFFGVIKGSSDNYLIRCSKMPGGETFLRFKRDVSRDDVWDVAETFAQAILKGQDWLTAWMLMCYHADALDDAIMYGEEPQPRPLCARDPCDSGGLHVCRNCARLRRCDDMVDVEADTHRLCKQCIDGHYIAISSPPTLQEPWQQDLELRLRVVLYKENLSARLGMSNAEIVSAAAEWVADLLPFLVQDGSGMRFHDNLIDQEITREKGAIGNDGKHHNPYGVSIDALDLVVRTVAQGLRYHARHNINLTSDSVNRMMRTHFKTLLLALAELRDARDADAVDQAMARFRDGIYNRVNLGKFGRSQHGARSGQKETDVFPDVEATIQTSKLMPQTKSKQQTWRASCLKQVPSKQEFAKFDWEYFNRELSRAAEFHGVEDLEHLWKRDGLFFPFHQRSVLLAWDEQACLAHFHEKLVRMRNECDRKWKDIANRPDCSLGEFMLTIAHLWMSMLASDQRSGKYGTDHSSWGRDDAGLIPIANIWSPLTSSIGHKIHGYPMTTGLYGYDPLEGSNTVFVEQDCNILYETQATNGLKFCYDESTYYNDGRFFEQISRVRTTPLPNSPVPFPRYPLVDTALRDEINVPDPDEVDEDEEAFEDDADGLLPAGADDRVDQLRCVCVTHEDAEDWPADFSDCPPRLIRCNQCLCLQHRECMNLDELDDDEEDDPSYACPFCDSIVAEDLRNTRVPVTVEVPDGFDAVAALNPRNMGRLGSTCWLSVTMQLLLRLPTVQNALWTGQLTPSGRKPGTLERYGHAKLVRFYFSIASLNRNLRQDGLQLSRRVTSDLLNAAHAVDETWSDRYLDPHEFMEFMMEMLNLLDDQSSPDNLIEGLTPLEVFNLDLRELAAPVESLPELRQHVQAYIQAVRDSGHTSRISMGHLLFTVQEDLCAHCDAVTRRFGHHWTLVIRAPEREEGKRFTLQDARSASIREVMSSYGLCCNKDCPTNQDDYSGVKGEKDWASRSYGICKMPSYLTININRGYEANDAIACRFDEDIIDLSEWRTPSLLPSMKGRSIVPSGGTKYRRIGVVGWLKRGSHLTLHMQCGYDNKGEWFFFDDREDMVGPPRRMHPSDLDPKYTNEKGDKLWDGFTEAMVLYKKLEQDEVIEVRAARVPEQAHVSQLVGEKTVIATPGDQDTPMTEVDLNAPLVDIAEEANVAPVSDASLLQFDKNGGMDLFGGDAGDVSLLDFGDGVDFGITGADSDAEQDFPWSDSSDHQTKSNPDLEYDPMSLSQGGKESHRSAKSISAQHLLGLSAGGSEDLSAPPPSSSHKHLTSLGGEDEAPAAEQTVSENQPVTEGIEAEAIVVDSSPPLQKSQKSSDAHQSDEEHDPSDDSSQLPPPVEGVIRQAISSMYGRYNGWFALQRIDRFDTSLYEQDQVRRGVLWSLIGRALGMGNNTYGLGDNLEDWGIVPQDAPAALLRLMECTGITLDEWNAISKRIRAVTLGEGHPLTLLVLLQLHLHESVNLIRERDHSHRTLQTFISGRIPPSEQELVAAGHAEVDRREREVTERERIAALRDQKLAKSLQYNFDQESELRKFASTVEAAKATKASFERKKQELIKEYVGLEQQLQSDQQAKEQAFELNSTEREKKLAQREQAIADRGTVLNAREQAVTKREEALSAIPQPTLTASAASAQRSSSTATASNAGGKDLPRAIELQAGILEKQRQRIDAQCREINRLGTIADEQSRTADTLSKSVEKQADSLAALLQKLPATAMAPPPTVQQGVSGDASATSTVDGAAQLSQLRRDLVGRLADLEGEMYGRVNEIEGFLDALRSEVRGKRSCPCGQTVQDLSTVDPTATQHSPSLDPGRAQGDAASDEASEVTTDDPLLLVPERSVVAAGGTLMDRPLAGLRSQSAPLLTLQAPDHSHVVPTATVALSPAAAPRGWSLRLSSRLRRFSIQSSSQDTTTTERDHLKDRRKRLRIPTGSDSFSFRSMRRLMGVEYSSAVARQAARGQQVASISKRNARSMRQKSSQASTEQTAQNNAEESDQVPAESIVTHARSILGQNSGPVPTSTSQKGRDFFPERSSSLPAFGPVSNLTTISERPRIDDTHKQLQTGLERASSPFPDFPSELGSEVQSVEGERYMSPSFEGFPDFDVNQGMRGPLTSSRALQSSGLPPQFLQSVVEHPEAVPVRQDLRNAPRPRLAQNIYRPENRSTNPYDVTQESLQERL